MTLTVEVEQEDDGRWLAEVPELPGVLAYGDGRDEAVGRVQALALRVLADRLDHGEPVPQVGNVFACRTELASVFRIGLTSNRLILLGIAAEIGVLLGLIVIPPLREVFGLEVLSPREWTLLLLFPPLVLLAEKARKLSLRARRGARLPRTTPGQRRR